MTSSAKRTCCFNGNPDLSIPPGQDWTTPWRFLDVPDGSHVFAITGHTHQYGTRVEINTSTGRDDPGAEIYPGEQDYLWDEPPVTYFEPALSFQNNSGFQYRCSYNNTSGGQVGFGESANQEMCFLWAYYYPSQGYRLCVNPGDIGGGAGGYSICCPGHFICSLLTNFL